MGAVSTILAAYNNQASRKLLRNMSFSTLDIFGLGLLTFAWEGVVCLIMAAPIGLLFTYIGYRIGYLVIKGRMKNNNIIIVIVLILSVPVFMAFENLDGSSEVLRSVTTSIEINAKPAAVLKNVIEFPLLGQPKEFVFRTGIAYPISAQINGRGVGAVRRVAKGGHDIPEEVIERRYYRGIFNLFSLFIPVVDTWMIVNSTNVVIEPIAEGGRGIGDIISNDYIWGNNFRSKRSTWKRISLS